MHVLILPPPCRLHLKHYDYLCMFTDYLQLFTNVTKLAYIILQAFYYVLVLLRWSNHALPDRDYDTQIINYVSQII